MVRSSLIFLVGFGVILAESAAPSTGLGQWDQFGALGILAAVVFWLLMREIPANRQSHRETLDKIVEQFEAREKRRDEAAAGITSALEMLKMHCARQGPSQPARTQPAPVPRDAAIGTMER